MQLWRLFITPRGSDVLGLSLERDCLENCEENRAVPTNHTNLRVL